MKKAKLLIMVLALVFFCNGCAVFMALHGDRDANIGALDMGQDRDIVLLGPVDYGILIIYSLSEFPDQFGNRPFLLTCLPDLF